MCPLSPPPAPFFVPWPPQAPGNWLGFVGFLALVCLVWWLPWLGGRARSEVGQVQLFSPIQRVQQICLVILRAVSVLFVFFMFVVYFPSKSQSSAWFASQLARFLGHNCSLDSFFRADSHLIDVPTTVARVVLSTVVVGALTYPAARLIGWLVGRDRPSMVSQGGPTAN